MKDKKRNADHFKNDGSNCPIRTNCPFRSTHSRLQEAHRHFHDAEANYDEPEGFRSYLNSCIQALRNVTFALQSQKSLIIGFDEWYGPWQERMRSDRILKWIVDARNQIVKQDDLEIASVANVTILDGYSDVPAFQFPVHPFETLPKISRDLIDSLSVPVSIFRNGILRLERRWIASGITDVELLSALAHAYALLAYLVGDAHRPVEDRADSSILPEQLPGQVLPCMAHLETSRVFLVKLRDQYSMAVRRRNVDTSAFDFRAAQLHYGLTEATFPKKLKEEPDLRAECESLFKMARTVMEKDGSHMPLVICQNKSRGTLIHLDARDRSEKYMLWRHIAKEVEKLKAHAVIAINEVWTAPFDPDFPHRSATDSPNRQEALALDAVSFNGDRVCMSARIWRTTDGVVLGETVEHPDMVPYYLEPVLDVWRAMFSRSVKAKNMPKL